MLGMLLNDIGILCTRKIFAPFYFNPRSQRAILRLGEFKTILIKLRRLYIA